MTEINFIVEGDPVGQPRARFANGHAYSASGSIDGWRAAVRRASFKTTPKTPLEGPIFFGTMFVMPRPKKHFRKGKLRPDAPSWHVAKPDFDNLAKAIADELTNAGYWKDDSQICESFQKKIYGEQPGCVVSIRQLPPGGQTSEETDE